METRMHFDVGEIPDLGDRAMNWAGFVFEIIGVSLFGDEVYAKPLPNFCTDGEWHYQLGKEPRWIELSSLIPMAKPNTASSGR